MSAPQEPSGKHVAIFLATLDGERFLSDQLQSYALQTHDDWSLHVSDDGSSDATRGIVEKFSTEQSRSVTFRDGPRQGFCRNFMSLVQDQRIEADYFAFSDQDDIWYADKLERALSYFQSVPRTTPAMYCSRTELVDESRRHAGFSPLFVKPPAFQNALVQNIGGGNTMVFNAAAKTLLEATGDTTVVSHDWWTYQIVSAAGGTVFYDPRPSIEYRQHSDNILGSNRGFRARAFRMRLMFAGRVKAWNDTNLRALQTLRSHLTAGSLETLDKFIAARDANWLPARIFYLVRSRVYRQSVLADLGLMVAAALRKL